MDDQEAQNIRGRYVPPSIDKQSYNCPHCGSLTDQTWYRLTVNKSKHTPFIAHPTSEDLYADIEDDEQRQKMEEFYHQCATGRPTLSDRNGSSYPDYDLINLNISRCYNCKEPQIWIYDKLAWPARGTAPLPNVDMPADILSDYQEADSILNSSPRGAAALLRLAIQKLCKFLGGQGKNLDHDIRELVEQGLSIKVQRALDVVRVIGNNAVHPGQIDLKDDVATAERMFSLINLIVQEMISNARMVDEMYSKLPLGALEAIERRDSKEND